MMHKIMENRRKQHVFSTAHKRRIRDKVNPQLRAVRKAWSDACRERNPKIKLRGHEQKRRVQWIQRNQKLVRNATILANKKRIRKAIAGRR